jgi:hypothetical protein
MAEIMTIIRVLRFCGLALLLAFVAPVALAAAMHFAGDELDWRGARRDSAGLLPKIETAPQAMVRVFAARTVRWRGIFATHCWIVVKGENGERYERFDYTGWGGEPVRINGYAPDGLWFGREPELVLAVDGEIARQAIPKLRAAIESYAFRARGDYRAWPGPNSNSFVATVLAAAPELRAKLPTTAIGKDFPVDGSWLASTPSGTGYRLSVGGYGGVTVGWYEGIELSLFGAVLGLELRRPAINLPALGRFGVPDQPTRE